MATRRALVKDLNISWKEANGYVLQAEKELGLGANEDQIITYAKDAWSAQTGQNEADVQPATSPVEDTENTTDPSVDTQQDEAILKEEEHEKDEEQATSANENVKHDMEEMDEPPINESPPSTPTRPKIAQNSMGVSTTIETIDPSSAVRASMIDQTVMAPGSSRGPRKSLRVAFFDLGSSDINVVMNTLNDLTDMNLHSKKHKKKTKEVISQGAAPMGVLQAMRNHGRSNAVVAEKSLALLLALTATGEKDCQNALVELDGTAAILTLMHCHTGPDNVNTQVHGLGLLCNLSATTATEATRISHNGGVDAIVKDMKEFPDLTFVQRRGCKCLANLAAMHPKLKDEIRSKEGVSTIGAALESFEEGDSVFYEARRAMMCFL